MSHAQEHHIFPLTTWGRAQKTAAEEGLVNYSGSHTEHKEVPSKNLSKKAQQAEPLLTCEHPYPQAGARRQ